MKQDGRSQTGATLLYVEDDDITREMVCTLIRRRFPKLVIHSAANGAMGLQLFAELHPDLVITDIKMPVLSGIEMSRRILELDHNVPIVVTSAHSDMEFLIESIEIGITRYVMKPIEGEKLFSALEWCLGRLALEKELQAQQAYVRKLSRAVEQSPSSIVITDPEGVVEYVNPKFTELTGYGAEEVQGRNLREMDELSEELWGRFAQGEEWQGELEGTRKNGERYFEATSISPVFDEQGKIRNVIAVKEDITERKRNAREIEQLNQILTARANDLERANRDLEAFGYTVSHDLRTPLTNINGYCQLITELFGGALSEDCKQYIEIIINETMHMNELIKTLLDFSKVNGAEIKPTRTELSEMANVIAAALSMREPGRKLEFEIKPEVTADCDPELLRVVLNNLLSNACKYTGFKDQPRIEFGVTDSEEDTYYVRDNGAGFDMANASKLFNPFQRLHSDREFSGFGIGLATVQRIVQRHGGKVWAEGEVDKGATFYFTLPRPQESSRTL
jgi:PAS domain S-box-containing protein